MKIRADIIPGTHYVEIRASIRVIRGKVFVLALANC